MKIFFLVCVLMSGFLLEGHRQAALCVESRQPAGVNRSAIGIIGADVLLKNPARYLAGKRFGLVCNQASIDSRGRLVADVLCTRSQKQRDVRSGSARGPRVEPQPAQPELELVQLRQKRSRPDRLKPVAIFMPEHGFFLNHEAAAAVDSEKSGCWGCPLYSLHGKTKKPTAEMLAGLDLLVVDLPDIGVRCFTYLSTLKLVLEAAAESHIPVLVLDRPNPLKFWGAAGPVLEEQYTSFVGRVYTRFLHGLTIGEIARLIVQDLARAGERVSSGVPQLTVLGSCADMPYDEERFVSPSPNLPSFEHVLVYPMTVFLEGTNYSEGRGTDLPFFQFGAPWVNAQELARELGNAHLSGIIFEPIEFAPCSLPGRAEHPKHENKKCRGVRITIIDRMIIKPVDAAFVILKTLFTLYPQESKWLLWDKKHYGIDLLLGTDIWRNLIDQDRVLAVKI